jgi:Flp pilus assembly pilin Flp
MLTHFRRFLGDEEGVATVEYALLLAIMVVATAAAWAGLAAKIRSTIQVSVTRVSTPLG